MWTTLQVPISFGLIAAFFTTIGLITVAQRSAWSERNANLFGLAAAGMLVTLTLLHITPEAFELSEHAPIWIFWGFIGGLTIHYAIESIFNPPEKQLADVGTGMASRVSVITPLLAIAIHSFIDGVIYAVTFINSQEAGLYAAISLILHEFPEGVIAFAILRRNGISNRWSFFFAFLAAAATTPLGVILSGPFVYNLGDETSGNLFALSAGLLLFVATGPLMAPIHEARPTRRHLWALGLGVII
ncbi:MAG: ZIP family metal transporter, partial [Pseudomonadota bacterium]